MSIQPEVPATNGKDKGYQPLDTFHEVLRLELEQREPVSKTPIRKLVYKILITLAVFFFFTRREKKNQFLFFFVYSLVKGCT